jgi:nucleoside-diphosphate-sugar epimerase
MKALVTGGAGFIGSHIAEALCGRGVEVVVLDNLSLGDAKNLAWKTSSHRLELIRGEAADGALLQKILPGCDWIFHEAALPSVPLSVSKPFETNQQNLDATLSLLIAARDAKVKRFIFASSSAIYGEGDAAPKRESDPPSPLSPYALQKYAAERYGQIFFQLYGLETVSLRYFNVFGPRQSFNSPYSGVIAKFCVAMLAGQSPTIFGDGLQSRDFTAVQNVVQANLLAAEAPAERAAGRVFNIAAGQSITLLDLVSEINKQTGQKIVPNFAEGRVGDIRASQADISAAKKFLAYSSSVSWRQGVTETLQFYRSKTS